MTEYSQRAIEVARDLFEDLERELRTLPEVPNEVLFHLDGSKVTISRPEAEEWAKDSVDQGFPEVRYYLEAIDNHRVVVNLAAFEDPDAQYHA